MKPMRRAIYIAFAALLFCGCSTHRDSILKKLDVYKAEFSEWPAHVPTDKTADAPLTGNGDIGLTMKTAEEGITFFIGKNDFWRALQSYPEGGLALPEGKAAVHYALYRNVYDEVLPDFSRLGKPAAEGYISAFSLEDVPFSANEDDFAIVFTSKMRVKEAGVYKFELSSDE